MSKKKKLYFQWIIPIFVVLIVTLACGTSTTEQLQEAVAPTTISEELVELEEENGGEISDDDEIEVIVDDVTEATTEEVKPLELINFGFGQDGRSAGYAFILENTNQEHSINNSQYQIAAFDGDDIVIDTDSGYIELILPGQVLGVGGDLYVEEGKEISRIEVQIKDGNSEKTSPVPSFEVSNLAYFPGEYFSHVTSVISNPYELVLPNLRISAVLFDSSDEIIGGGFTYLNFINPNSSAGVRVSVTSYGEVERYEIYPAISGITFFGAEREVPNDATEITITNFGFGQQDRSGGFGFLLNNPNNNYSVENSEYHVTVYDSDNTVLSVEEGYVNVVTPNQTLGVGGDIYVPSGEIIDRIVVQIKQGKFVESEVLPFFESENVEFSQGSFSSKVTGVITNPFSLDITNLRASAIAYNENGDIIGGGFTFVNFVLAGSKSAVEITVYTSEIPSYSEIYAAVSSLSVFEE